MSLFFKKQVKRPFLWRAGLFSWSQTHEQSEAARGRRAGPGRRRVRCKGAPRAALRAELAV